MGADNKRNLCAHEVSGSGDIDAVLDSCDYVIDRVYHTKANQQAMMETFRTYTYLDTYGRLNVVSSTQVPFHVRRISRMPLISRNIKCVWSNRGSGRFRCKADFRIRSLSGDRDLEDWETGEDHLYKRRITDRVLSAPRDGDACPPRG